MASTYENPEPVPNATQLAVLPFLAGISGLLARKYGAHGLRITLHRVISQEGRRYLQQTSDYVDENAKLLLNSGGRFSEVDKGIIGGAYLSKKTHRTKKFDNKDDLIKKVHPEGKLEPTLSWLAIPFLGKNNDVVCVLYSDCKVFNFFSNDEIVKDINNMCRGYCALCDDIQEKSLGNIRNFPMARGKDTSGSDMPMYDAQEYMDIVLPKFSMVDYFNYEYSNM